MSEGALVNTGAVRWPDPVLAGVTVRSMQIKLHRWAGEDSSRRFGDLFNLVYDPAFLVVAWLRVSANKGANTAGIDKVTAAWVEAVIGVGVFLGQIRDSLKSGEFRPAEVRQVMIPKGNTGKFRKLGIPAIADRVVQASLKLVLEPVFEADFQPCSYGFRPNRRPHDAIAEIHLYRFKTHRKVSGLGIYGVISCCSVVLVDHAAEYLPALDWRVRRRDFRHVKVGRSLLAGLVRAVPVVVARELAEDRSKVPFVVDKHPVGALGSCGPYPSFGVTVRARGPRRGLDYHHARTGEDLVEGGGELGVAVPDEEAEGTCPLFKIHEQVASLLSGPRAVRMVSHAQDVHVPGPYLHDEQDVQTFEEDRVDGEEVAGQQSLRLSAQERPP